MHAESLPGSSAAFSYKNQLRSALAAYKTELVDEEEPTVSSQASTMDDRDRMNKLELSSKSTSELIGSSEVEDMAFQVLGAIREAIPIDRRSLNRR